MMLKCGKKKKVTHEVIAECVTDVFFSFLASLIFYWTDEWQHGVYLFYVTDKHKENISDVIYTSVLQLIIFGVTMII